MLNFDFDKLGILEKHLRVWPTKQVTPFFGLKWGWISTTWLTYLFHFPFPMKTINYRPIMTFFFILLIYFVRGGKNRTYFSRASLSLLVLLHVVLYWSSLHESSFSILIIFSIPLPTNSIKDWIDPDTATFIPLLDFLAIN